MKNNQTKTERGIKHRRRRVGHVMDRDELDRSTRCYRYVAIDKQGKILWMRLLTDREAELANIGLSQRGVEYLRAE